MEIEADRRAAMPKRPTRMRSMKSSRDVAASWASKVMTMAPSSPVAASRRSRSRRWKAEQRVLRPQEKPRVRREGQSRRGTAEFLGALQAPAPITARWPR